MFEKEKVVEVILSKMKKPDFVEEIAPSQHGFEQAAHEIIMAVDKGDAIKLAHSLKNFFDMCCQED